MGERDDQTMSRLELADYLTNLGEQLRQGTFAAQGRHWTVPDDLCVRMEFKEKKGHLAARLSWSWSTLGDYDRAAREEITRGQDSMKTVKKRLGAEQGDRCTRFEHPGGDGIEFEAMELIRPG